ncbi:MAG: HDOD domain-containing protein [Cellvibrionaceae bacterium]|nr:HDOD domain-containing protein [Cellvibrionaceae bacterium]
MSLLKHVFPKGNKSKELETESAVVEPRTYGLQEARENYFCYLYPKETSAPLSVPQKLVVDVVKNSLSKRSARDKAVPRLPMVIPKLLRSLRDPDSCARDYVKIINKDPVMSAAVLKLANSAYFNPTGTRINDIEPAVIKLGIEGLRSVLSAAVMQPIIQKDSPYFSQSGQRMWHHSLCCAVACEIIAEHRRQERFKYYLMGLVHDIGNITIFSELCRQFKMNGENQKPGYNAFVPLMKVLSPAVSFWVAKDWELPKEVCKALAEQVNIQAKNKISVYGHVLYQANLVAEIYACHQHEKQRLPRRVLSDLKLPLNMYQKLEQLSIEV